MTTGTAALVGGMYLSSWLLAPSCKHIALAGLALTLTIGGFVVQWLGLRGLHWSVSVAQVGAVCIMTALRSWRKYARTAAIEAEGAQDDPASEIAAEAPEIVRLSLVELAERAGLRDVLHDGASMQPEAVLARAIAVIKDHVANNRTVHADWGVFWLLHYAGVHLRDDLAGAALVRDGLAEYLDDLDLFTDGLTDTDADTDLDTRPQLIEATIANNTLRVAALLASGATPDERDFRGRTALHYASQLGHSGVLLLLMQHDQVRLDARDSSGYTALDLAAGGIAASLLLFHGAEDTSAVQRRLHSGSIHAAVWRGSKRAVVRLLQLHPHCVHERDEDGNTPLHGAGAAGMARVLLLHGARVQEPGQRGETALHCAARTGRVCVLEVLLAAGADVRTECAAGMTPFNRAVQAGNSRVLEVLIRHGGGVVDRDGALLRAAAASGSAETVEFVIRRAEGDVHSVCAATADTPLHVASSPQAAKALLDHGADIAAVNRTRQTSLHCAASRGPAATVALLLPRGAAIDARNLIGDTPLHCAASAGHPAAVTTLLAHGATVDATNTDIETPLHRAAQEGHRDVLILLLASGASVHATSHPRKTALHMASRSGHAPCVQLLLHHGSALHATDITVQTSLHMAASWGHAAAAEVLLSHGADVAAEDEHARSPLHLAAEDGHVDVVRMLLRRGAGVAARDEWARTPLHAAAEGGHVEAVVVLLEGGASHAVVDARAMTPLHGAARRGRVQVVRVLLGAGADVGARSYWRETAVMLAEREGHAETVQVMVEWGAVSGGVVV